MLATRGYATRAPDAKLGPFQFCIDHDIAADVEVIPIQDIEMAYERTIRGDVRYRFVIDMKTL